MDNFKMNQRSLASDPICARLIFKRFPGLAGKLPWIPMADLPTPVPPPVTPDGKPITPEMLAPVFPMNLIEQEANTKRFEGSSMACGHPGRWSPDCNCDRK